MVDFAGWSMPVQYASIIEEHLATRTAAGMFDVSHMGRLDVTGSASRDWLESLLTRRVADLDVGRCRYTLVTTEDAGVTILDAALVGRVVDAADGTPQMTLVVNASNRDRVVAWLRGRLPATGVVLVDRTTETAMIAVQGPAAVGIVCSLCADADAARIGGLGNYRCTSATVAGIPAAVSRTGYTGEDGVELVVPGPHAVAVWEALLAAGGPRGLRTCGLGARDTLRLEAGMPLYGHELTANADPFALGLGLAVNLESPQGTVRTFPGAAALRRMRDEPARRVRVGLAGVSRRAAREGAAVLRPGDAAAVGVVTSGSFSPSLGHAVAMALVDREAAVSDAPLEVAVREAREAVRVTSLPFYRRTNPRK
jgi:aminomethyltransferase